MPHDQNPLLAQWLGPYGLPPFGAVAAAHYRPAFEQALAEHRAEIDRIAQNPAAPDFDNTIAALEDSGACRGRSARCSGIFAGPNSTPELEEIEREISGVLARHASETSMNAALFARIDALYERRETLGLTPEQSRVLELTHKDFIARRRAARRRSARAHDGHRRTARAAWRRVFAKCAGR